MSCEFPEEKKERGKRAREQQQLQKSSDPKRMRKNQQKNWMEKRFTLFCSDYNQRNHIENFVYKIGILDSTFLPPIGKIL